MAKKLARTRIAKKPAGRRNRQARFSGTVAARLSDADEIYAQLKICFSRITGFPISDIHEADVLEEKYKFNAGGLRVLAQNLEACFSHAGHPFPAPLSRDDIQKATTVGDVAEVLNEAFGVP